MPGVNGPRNLVALDQEDLVLVAVINAERHWDPGAPASDDHPADVFDPWRHLEQLPDGGGLVVGDANVWGVRNGLSVSQYCWPSDAERARFVAALAERGYRAVVIANKLAQTLYQRAGIPQSQAVVALADYLHAQVAGEGPGELWCGCATHREFHSGHAVRAPRGDRSFGQRDVVVRDFLRLQNQWGYDTAFAEDVVAIADAVLARDDRSLRPLRGQLMLKKTRPECDVAKRNRLMAVAVCTHDPQTGARREHAGRPWGVDFITRRVIGLSGATRGTGANAAGNPMRAVLRSLGRRPGTPGRGAVDRAARADLDRAVRLLVTALLQHPDLRSVDWPAPTP